MICRSEDIKAAVSMRQAAEFYGFKPDRSGFICCPFHGEKTPSLKIYPDGRGWWCYGCNSGGSVIDFVESLFHLNFIDACKRINSDFSLGMDFGGKRDFAAERKARDKLKLERISKEAFVKWQFETQRTLCQYYRILYHAMRSGDAGNPLFFEALQNIGRVDYLIDALRDNPKEFYKTCREEVDEIRKNKTMTGLKI